MMRPIKLMPVLPSPRATKSAERRTAKVISETIRIAANTPPRFGSVWALPASTMTVAMAPGPANSGSPSGRIAMSSLPCASSSSSAVERVPEGFARSISMPTPKSRIPPAILNAGSEIEKKLMMIEPAAANTTRTPKHVTDARSAIRRRSSRERSPVSATKIGSAANGSTIAKTDPNVTSRWVTRSECTRCLTSFRLASGAP
ncbi:hypothetical protein BH09MYX1_BH09MYX1_43720 [soil metagenome]